MKNPIKVKTTKIYKNSQERHTVCKGKLVLVVVNEPTLLHIEADGLLMFYDNPCIYSNSKNISPIIISKTEEIEIGDNYLDRLNTIQICSSKKENILYPGVANSIGSKKGIGFNKFSLQVYHKDFLKLSDCFKILALPENFSSKTLKDIVDGKLKDGDDVFVEVCKGMNYSYPNLIMGIKIDKNNHIKLFPLSIPDDNH